MSTNKITLGSVVVVSDPCYTIPTWCQEIIRDVLPGEYHVFVDIVDTNGWGDRVSLLTAVHKDYLDEKLSFRHFSSLMGVDSGQGGIFDFDSYRNDVVAQTIESPAGVSFDLPYRDQEGDEWYEKICKFTLGEEQWGHYDTGVVSSSGYGDGQYDIKTARKKNKTVAISIDYNVLRKPDFNFYRKEVLV